MIKHRKKETNLNLLSYIPYLLLHEYSGISTPSRKSLNKAAKVEIFLKKFIQILATYII